LYNFQVFVLVLEIKVLVLVLVLETFVLAAMCKYLSLEVECDEDDCLLHLGFEHSSFYFGSQASIQPKWLDFEATQSSHVGQIAI